jgi:hypothetical protein
MRPEAANAGVAMVGQVLAAGLKVTACMVDGEHHITLANRDGDTGSGVGDDFETALIEALDAWGQRRLLRSAPA